MWLAIAILNDCFNYRNTEIGLKCDPLRGKKICSEKVTIYGGDFLPSLTDRRGGLFYANELAKAACRQSPGTRLGRCLSNLAAVSASI